MFLATSIWGIAKVILFVIGGAILVFILNLLYFTGLSIWSDKRTNELSYFGLHLRGRRRFKRTLSRLGSLATPFLWFLSRLSPVSLDAGSLKFGNFAVPKHSCSAEKLEDATTYVPTADDVFVATQMKCGTTWMLHLVYQILCRGHGDLVETGRALHADVPWIESTKSVSMKGAKMLGEDGPKRLIKTHLPASHCPFSESARYIYVVRHPVSCFASTVDFIRTNLGPFTLPLRTFEDWYCSEQMWFTPWPDHVDGWWRLANEQSNVLLVLFENMKSDLALVAGDVAQFLGVKELSPEELGLVLEKCSFDYMKDNMEAFEMSVPTVLQHSAKLFVSGDSDRHKDVPHETENRILEWCRRAFKNGHEALEDLYPDVAASTQDDDQGPSSIDQHGP